MSTSLELVDIEAHRRVVQALERCMETGDSEEFSGFFEDFAIKGARSFGEPRLWDFYREHLIDDFRAQLRMVVGLPVVERRRVLISDVGMAVVRDQSLAWIVDCPSVSIDSYQLQTYLSAHSDMFRRVVRGWRPSGEQFIYPMATSTQAFVVEELALLKADAEDLANLPRPDAMIEAKVASLVRIVRAADLQEGLALVLTLEF